MSKTPSSLFESEVIRMISEMLSEGEELFRDVVPALHGADVAHVKGTYVSYADLYLPNGLKKLGIKENSFIECKSILSYNSIRHIRNLFLQLPENSHLYIITNRDHDDFHKFFGLPDKNVHLLTFNEFAESYKQIIPDSKTVNNQHETERSRIKTQDTACDDPIINKANVDFSNGNVTLVLGAGVSASAGLPGWDVLLHSLLDDSLQNPLEVSDYAAIGAASFHSQIIKARYILSAYRDDPNREYTIVTKMHDALYKTYKGKSSELIETIVEMCGKKISGFRNVSRIITLNYDDLVEEGLAKHKIDHTSIFKEGKYEGDKLPIIHMHGIINRQNPIAEIPILTEDSYHDLYRRGNSWANIELLHALYRNTCIFIGLSMSDPNIRRLLEFVHAESGNAPEHYAILPLRQLSNHNWDSPEPKKYYEKNPAKETAFRLRQEEVYRQLGINVIWYEDNNYSKIPEILRRIAGIATPTPL